MWNVVDILLSPPNDQFHGIYWICLSHRLFNFLIGDSYCQFQRKYWNFLELSTSLLGDPYSWIYGNITTFSTFRRLYQWSKWLVACRMYSFWRYFSLHPGWLKLRLKVLGAILILMWFCNLVFVDISKQWPLCSTRGALGRPLPLLGSSAQSCIYIIF